MAATVVVKGPRPPHQKQLQTGSPTGGEDCGVITTLHGLEYASGNKLKPNPKRPAKEWVRLLRNRMAKQLFWPATNISNQEQALEHDRTDAEMALIGLTPVVATKFLPGTYADLVAQLKAGRWVGIATSYREFNRIMPKLSGDRAFMGDHMVGVVGYGRDAKGREWGWLYDPTHDGRRPGIPKGPQQVQLALLFQTAAARTGLPPDTASFISVRRSKPV
jgi:hypothetical protein